MFTDSSVGTLVYFNVLHQVHSDTPDVPVTEILQFRLFAYYVEFG